MDQYPNPNTPNTPPSSNPNLDNSFLQLLNIPPNTFQNMQGFYNPNLPPNAFQNNPYPTQNTFQNNPYPPPTFTPQQLQQLHQLQQQHAALNQQSNLPSPNTQSSKNTVDDDVEVVPETQPEFETRAARRGKKKASTEPLKRLKWSEKEEVVLAESYIAISCDPEVGNAQSNAAFWERISVQFHKSLELEPYRTEDALSGKWAPLRAECTKFNGVYNNTVTLHASGHASHNVTESAMATYKAKYGKPFTHLLVWRVLHSNPKWEWLPDSASQSSGSKRSAPEPIDINSDPIDVDMNEPEQRSKRPIGRTKSKKLAKEQQEAQSSAKHIAEIVADKLSDKLAEHLAFLKDFAAQKKEQHEEAQIEREMMALCHMPRSDVPQEDLEVVRRMKAKIRAKHHE